MITPLAELVFGRLGNAAGCLLQGWAPPEDGFTWAVGHASALRIPLPPLRAGSAVTLELDVNPFVAPGVTVGQRLMVTVNGLLVGAARIEGDGIVGYRIPAEVVGSSRSLLVELQHPDAQRPVDLGFNSDARTLGFMLRSAAVLPAFAEAAAERRLLPPIDLPETPDTEILKEALRLCTGQTAAELLLNFESLGHNCEFGIMQRHCGAEPLGLLRFVGITLPDLVRALDCGFAEVGNDRWLRVFAHPGPRPEFLVCDMRHNISFHSFRYEDETTADQVRAEQGQQLRFFHRKFMEVLETGERLFVFQRPKQILAEQMLPLLNQLRSYGPNALLYVTEGGEHPPGSVEQVGYGLYHGHTSAVAPAADVGAGDLRAWLSICANAMRLWRDQMGIR